MSQDCTLDRANSGVRADPDGALTLDLSGRYVGSSYLLVQPIGQGATGTVWRGIDRATGEPVAVKLLHESLLRQPKLVTRFVQERTILLMLRHRNVVRVRDLFSVGETLGLVMDLVTGGTLRDHLRSHHTVPPGEAARLAAQVAAALAEAHQLGVVHRDLKPDNILLATDGGRLDTRLTDFGVARILNTPSMTTSNAVVGTPHYMAPEAFHGPTADPATDVYALGVLLYELVCGRPPYDSDSIPDLMRRHLAGDPRRRPGIPDPLWDVIMSCLATKPRLRPPAAELVADLTDIARRFGDLSALPPPDGSESLEPPPGGSESFERPAGRSESFRPPVGRSEPLEPADDGVAPGRAGRRVSRADVASEVASGCAGPDVMPSAPQPYPPSIVPAPRQVRRRTAVPSRRWRRPGAAMSVIAGAMLASAVATTAWNFGRAGGDSRESTDSRALAAPSAVPHQTSAAPRTGTRPTLAARQARPAVAPTSTPVPPHTGPAVSGPADSGPTGSGPAGPADSGPTGSRSPQPEAQPYGPWQCTQGFDLGDRIPLGPKPCQMLGRDIQYRASLTAPGGATARISVSLQDADSGSTVAGPKTCDGLSFTGDAATRDCGPAAASPPRGHRYAVVISYRYERNGEIVTNSSKGPAFAW